MSTRTDPLVAWIAIYAVACGVALFLSVLVARGGPRGRKLSLVVWAVAVQLPLVEAGYFTGGGDGALGGLLAGMNLAACPLPFAYLLALNVASRNPTVPPANRWQQWVARRDEEVVVRAATFGWTVWFAQGVVLALAGGAGMLVVLGGLGLIGLVWVADGIARQKGWARPAVDWLVAPLVDRCGPARSEDVKRIARATGVGLLAMGVVVALGMRFGAPESRVVNAYLAGYLGGGFGALNAFGVLAAWVAIFGCVTGLAQVAKPSPAELRLVCTGSAIPLGLWLAVAAALPADVAMWGVMLTAIAWLTVLYSLLVAERSTPTTATAP